jgi:hypothetical protein
LTAEATIEPEGEIQHTISNNNIKSTIKQNNKSKQTNFFDSNFQIIYEKQLRAIKLLGLQ